MFAVKQTDSASTVAKLSQLLGVDFSGDGDQRITSVSSLTRAKSTELCFVRSNQYASQLQQSDCAAAIVPLNFQQKMPDKALLFSPNPHLDFVRVIDELQLYRGYQPEASIHPSAIIAETAEIDDSVSIAGNCVIGDRVKLERNVQLGSGCIIEDGVTIGAGSRLLANVTICFDVSLGAEVIIQPGAVIGGDGFGLVYHDERWIKVPHLGSVRIGDRVEIGANTTIDRGALDDTIIEQGVKIDNLVQVGHNVFIGENTAIAGCAGIAGSTTIGKNCRISGAVGIVGHLNIADDVTVTAKSLVMRDIIHGGVYSSGTPLMENRLWHRNNVRYKSLDRMAKTLSNLQKKIK